MKFSYLPLALLLAARPAYAQHKACLFPGNNKEAADVWYRLAATDPTDRHTPKERAELSARISAGELFAVVVKNPSGQWVLMTSATDNPAWGQSEGPCPTDIKMIMTKDIQVRPENDSRIALRAEFEQEYLQKGGCRMEAGLMRCDGGRVPLRNVSCGPDTKYPLLCRKTQLMADIPKQDARDQDDKLDCWFESGSASAVCRSSWGKAQVFPCEGRGSQIYAPQCAAARRAAVLRAITLRQQEMGNSAAGLQTAMAVGGAGAASMASRGIFDRKSSGFKGDPGTSHGGVLIGVQKKQNETVAMAKPPNASAFIEILAVEGPGPRAGDVAAEAQRRVGVAALNEKRRLKDNIRPADLRGVTLSKDKAEGTSMSRLKRAMNRYISCFFTFEDKNLSGESAVGCLRREVFGN